MQCGNCRIDYPEGYVMPFTSSLGNQPLCGVCALEASNKIHKTNRLKFDGETAEEMRQKALAFRKKHNLNPAKPPSSTDLT
jgi:hypothetical protein